MTLNVATKSQEKRTKEEENRPTETNLKQLPKMAIRTWISILTLNISGLTAPTKRHRLAEGIQKQDPYICCPQETHIRPKDI